MISVLVVVGGLVVAVAAIALILPCEACRLRRERMKQAYAQWQSNRAAKE
jgi:hypothetical protein